MPNIPKVSAIITAAGQSRRMGGVDKMTALLAGKPVFYWVVSVFQACKAVDEIVLVLSSQNLELGRRLVAEQCWNKVIDVCPGGERRQDSVAAGLKRIRSCDWVVIHDGARPLVTTDMIERGLQAAKETGAAIAAVPAVDTIKIAGEDCIIQQTPSRDGVWAAQTPQVFRFDIIVEAYRQANTEATDDASLVEKLGYKVKLYMGSYANMKITTPDDLALAEVLVARRAKCA